MPDNVIEKITSLAKRRGFIFPSSEIYGGINACWDYGPLGVRLKNNIKAAWMRAMTQLRDDIEPLDAAILMHPRVWEASGHVENFTDPLVDCRACKHRFRADEAPNGVCPNCGSPNISDSRQFNMMLKTFMGPVEEEAMQVYLRPETAQGIYVNFENVRQSARRRIPFGIAQIGKAFRNEISPGNLIFRSREFEQMEMQYFIKPGRDSETFDHWRGQRMQWYLELGVTPERLRFREHEPHELAHYARRAMDIEYLFPFGWKELEGIHNRGDWDLSRHQQYSGKDLTYFDDQANERFIPWVIETSGGADRAALMFLVDSYDEEPDKEGVRTVLRFGKHVAPITVAILPLSKKEPLVELARTVERSLRARFVTDYDETASIGKRYRRQDEVGTPLCVTVDFESLEDHAVTIRERDSMAQQRVSTDRLIEALEDTLARLK
ncbi:MAG TPA: glycine--tRNA ligase [Chloroflexota bacterium]|nr:glycine--tRNA ligase [Chloroflexota bacterium]